MSGTPLNAPFAASPIDARGGVQLARPPSPHAGAQPCAGPQMALAPRTLTTTQVQCAPAAPMVQQVAPAPQVVQPVLPQSGAWTAGGICPQVQAPAAGTTVLPAELAALINAMQDRVDSAYLAKDYPQRHRHRHT